MLHFDPKAASRRASVPPVKTDLARAKLAPIKTDPKAGSIPLLPDPRKIAKAPVSTTNLAAWGPLGKYVTSRKRNPVRGPGSKLLPEVQQRANAMQRQGLARPKNNVTPPRKPLTLGWDGRSNTLPPGLSAQFPRIFRSRGTVRSVRNRRQMLERARATSGISPETIAMLEKLLEKGDYA